MSTVVEQQYRRFLLILSGFIFVGSAVELFFAEHYGNALQIFPFVLSAAGLLSVIAGLATMRKPYLNALRYVMYVIAAGSLFGIYEHVEHNFEFTSEIKPNLSSIEVFWEALHGASPFLAPGILFLGALLAYAATWKHPVLSESEPAG